MRKASPPDHLDLLLLSEPLACVLHAYKRIPTYLAAKTVTVFGGGPIGALHVIESLRRFPRARMQIVEPHPERRALLERLFPDTSIHESDRSIEPSDLAVVATSNPSASLGAIETANTGGSVLLFSGINHSHPDELPRYEGHDLEAIHRGEEIRSTSRHVRLIGSSGYHPHEISESSCRLFDSPGTYAMVQTGVVDQLEGVSISGQKTGDAAIARVLNDEETYQQHLKVVFRLDGDRVPDLKVVAGDQRRVELRTFDLEAVPAPRMVRVRMRRVSVCETDRRVLKGTKASKLSPGLVLGHEGVAVIEEVGSALPSTLVNALCVVLPHRFTDGDELEKRGVGYLSRKMLHLGIHVDGVFTSRADFPLSCLHRVQVMSASTESQRVAAPVDIAEAASLAG